MCKGGSAPGGDDAEEAAAAKEAAHEAVSQKRAVVRLHMLQQQALALVEQCKSVHCFSLDTAATYAAEIRRSTDADAMESGMQVLQKQYQDQVRFDVLIHTVQLLLVSLCNTAQDCCFPYMVRHSVTCPVLGSTGCSSSRGSQLARRDLGGGSIKTK